MKKKLLLLTIISFALVLRLYGLNWDQSHHLHPDERFLTMVGNSARIPSSLAEYLNPQASTLNPYNIGHNFYVYGTFPLTLNKVLSVAFGFDNYNDFTLFGRFLSALFDVGTLVVVYKIVELWERKYKLDKRLKYLSAFLYAIAVLPIQLSHFFTVDSFLNFFMIASLYFSLRFYYHGKLNSLIVSSVFFGLAFASKLSALYILPLLILLLLLGIVCNRSRHVSLQEAIRSVMRMLFFFTLIVYVVIRFADPKTFENANFLDVTINSQFLQNMQQVRVLSSTDAGLFPPAVQWFSITPFVFAAKNITFFGLGIPYLLFSIVGAGYLLKVRKLELYTLFFWVAAFFIYQSTQFSPSMRYFIFLYPFFAILAAFGLHRILTLKNKNLRYWSMGLSIILVLIWPLSFIQIYSKPHSRVQASYWINENITEGSFLAGEHWDDGLPLRLPDVEDKSYRFEQMPVFGEDTYEKWKQINDTLNRADYIIFSSNRGYGSIMPQPDLYPRMAIFYQDLFEGKLPFKKIKEFTSYPIFPLYYILHSTYFVFPDQWSEEAFTVYDHPRVVIFKKT